MKVGFNFDLVLNRLWLFVAIVSVLLVFLGIFLGIFGKNVYFTPSDTNVGVEVISGTETLKSAVGFVLAGVVITLLFVTVVLLVVLFLKKRKKKRIPKFNVFGIQNTNMGQI